jgi:molybdopterin-guanine dinucleotide biosynthesis protein A
MIKTWCFRAFVVSKKMQEINFYLLAGGNSRRFGENKALFMIEGKTLIERVIAAIPPAHEIFLVTNSQVAYAHLHLPALPDHYPGCGPLAGIHAGLAHSPHEWNFFLACDFPSLQTSVIEEILAAPREAQVILPQTAHGLQPLCALWSKKTTPLIESALQTNERHVRSVLSKLSIHPIVPQAPEALFNLNTKDDLQRLRTEGGQVYSPSRTIF